MTWTKCDHCGQQNYTEENPFIEMRIPRPSDPSCMTCVMAGHWKCFHRDTVPNVVKNEDYTSGGSLTPHQWEAWITSVPARKAGFIFLD